MLYKAINENIIEPSGHTAWSSLVEGDEQLHWPMKNAWNIAMHLLRTFWGVS